MADHSGQYGLLPDLIAGFFILADPTGKDWYDRIKAGKVGALSN